MVHLKFSHCAYCDAWGQSPKIGKHPMMIRMLELKEEGVDIKMDWHDCTVCVDYGAEKKTKVMIECELDKPYEMV